jgi:hypothetical protein
MPDRGDDAPASMPSERAALEREVGNAVLGRLVPEVLLRCPRLLNMSVVRGVADAQDRESHAETAEFVLRHLLIRRQGDLWSAARALAGIDPPLRALEDRRRAAARYLRQRGEGPGSSRTARRREPVVWSEITRVLLALDEQPAEVHALREAFRHRANPQPIVKGFSARELENERVAERPVIVGSAQQAVFVDNDGFKRMQRVTRRLVAQQDNVVVVGLEIRHEGGNDALAPRVLRGGRLIDKPAIPETPLGFRRYEIVLDRPLNRGDPPYELTYEVPIDRVVSAPQQPFAASAFDGDQHPGFTLTTTVLFTQVHPRRVLRIVGPSARWPRYAESRQSLEPALRVHTVFQEHECRAGAMVGLLWEW